MKKRNIYLSFLLSSLMILSSGCGISNKAKGGMIGGGSGAALGAGIGAIAGKGKGAAIGAAVGAVVGTTAGVLIGNKMDKQKKELEALENAQIEEVTDDNGLKAIKVTFSSGILFATGKSDLGEASRNELSKFAISLRDNPNTDINIVGHTDNTGTRDVNEKLSAKRAEAVATFLGNSGVSRARMTTLGKAFDEPVADNATPEGRTQNRRVEIFITANEQMIKEAEAGTLK
ncbi:MAG: OmpA family protein [Bacteroidales bacterium]